MYGKRLEPVMTPYTGRLKLRMRDTYLHVHVHVPA